MRILGWRAGTVSRNKKPRRGARRVAMRPLRDVCSPRKSKKYKRGQPKTLVDINFCRSANYHVQYAAPTESRHATRQYGLSRPSVRGQYSCNRQAEGPRVEVLSSAQAQSGSAPRIRAPGWSPGANRSRWTGQEPGRWAMRAHWSRKTIELASLFWGAGCAQKFCRERNCPVWVMARHPQNPQNQVLRVLKVGTSATGVRLGF